MKKVLFLLSVLSVLAARPAAAQYSTNKVFMLGTNNALRPPESSFFSQNWPLLSTVLATNPPYPVVVSNVLVTSNNWITVATNLSAKLVVISNFYIAGGGSFTLPPYLASLTNHATGIPTFSSTFGTVTLLWGNDNYFAATFTYSGGGTPNPQDTLMTITSGSNYTHTVFTLIGGGASGDSADVLMSPACVNIKTTGRVATLTWNNTYYDVFGQDGMSEFHSDFTYYFYGTFTGQ